MNAFEHFVVDVRLGIELLGMGAIVFMLLFWLWLFFTSK